MKLSSISKLLIQKALDSYLSERTDDITLEVAKEAKAALGLTAKEPKKVKPAKAKKTGAAKVESEDKPKTEPAASPKPGYRKPLFG